MMEKKMHVYAEVSVDEVIANFTQDEIVKALRSYRGLNQSDLLAADINVQKVMPALIDDLRVTQAAREKAKAWNEANRLQELREGIENAWRRYKGDVM